MSRYRVFLLAILIFGMTSCCTPATYSASKALSFKVAQNKEPYLTVAQKIKLLRQRVKYIFVLYQENRSFDSYFGTFPGADGLFSQPASQTPGFYQKLKNTDGKLITIHPFRIGPKQFASDTDDIDHSHPMIVSKMDIVDGKARMDNYALTEEEKYMKAGKNPLEAKQFGELAMAYEDGNTIPFLWRYASRFVLCDHIFQEMTGPSTPVNLCIIGAQTGVTQWILHPDLAYKANGSAGAGVPVLNDADPFWGSQLDPTPQNEKMPVNPKDFRNGKEKKTQYNLTFATLPLTLLGGSAVHTTDHDRNPQQDLADVDDDIAALARQGSPTIPWGWYQEDFDKESGETVGTDTVDAEGQHMSYVTHHNGPQYFGYISNNPEMSKNLHGLGDFYRALDNQQLPKTGGVFYVKGGKNNLLGLKSADNNPKVRKIFTGDDDHPGDSDSQISEAMIATTINKIAESPYWKHCAIVITWDDSEGDYDHVPPPLRGRGPDGSIINDGPRVPLILISPYAKAGIVDHESGDQASVVKLIDTVFDRTPLADLPDEEKGRQIGKKKYGLNNAGPFDDQTPGITNLLSAFDSARLEGKAPALQSSYAIIPKKLILTLPQKSGYGWRQLGIIPTDHTLHIKNDIPKDFNPRPKTEPTAFESK